MNNNEHPTQSFGGFPIIFAGTIGTLSILSVIIFTSYLCRRKQAQAETGPSANEASFSSDDEDSIAIEIGLDEATLNSYPKLVYSQANLDHDQKDTTTDSMASCCSICLAEYKDNDMLRLLPDCDHIFHLQCIDPWLKLRPSCPICRKSPIQTTPTEIPRRVSRRGFLYPWLP